MGPRKRGKVEALRWGPCRNLEGKRRGHSNCGSEAYEKTPRPDNKNGSSLGLEKKKGDRRFKGTVQTGGGKGGLGRGKRGEKGINSFRKEKHTPGSLKALAAGDVPTPQRGRSHGNVESGDTGEQDHQIQSHRNEKSMARFVRKRDLNKRNHGKKALIRNFRKESCRKSAGAEEKTGGGGGNNEFPKTAGEKGGFARSAIRNVKRKKWCNRAAWCKAGLLGVWPLFATRGVRR